MNIFHRIGLVQEVKIEREAKEWDPQVASERR